MEKRRPLSSETSQSSAGKKKSKLTLKPPSFITDARPVVKTLANQLEEVLNTESSEDVLDQLLILVNQADVQYDCSVSECVSVLTKLWERFNTDSPLCVVLLNILATVARSSDPSNQTEEILLSAVKHNDFSVKVAVLNCLQEIVQSASKEFKEQVMEVALNEIHCSSHKVRVACINLIGCLCYSTSHSDNALIILEERTCDADPRVRTAAFTSLYGLLSEGRAIPQSVYFKASECLSDDSASVRTEAMKVVWQLGLKHPDQMIPLKEDQSLEIRLLDDAFVKICNLVNDSCMSIRSLAAGLLGDFSSVSDKFLSQTLDKKLMSHLRIVKSEHERQKELHQQGASMDWETGRKWGGAVKMEVDAGEISLMNAGACGAFVHGLEDEFMEVRSAAISSMKRLGVNNSVFAGQCLDYLVDMFNDEIQAVRLEAISSLGQIAATMVLRDDQLETVLGILDESSGEIREALRNLLCSCQITTRAGLNTTIHSLLDNLKKYPNDKQSIWRCLQQLGAHHGNLVSTLVPELLSTHPFFMGKEPDVDDPAYICILILVFNAAAQCPTIPPLFPSHVTRHYSYLRDTLPLLIPHIRSGVPCVVQVRRRKSVQSGSGGFLSSVLVRAQSAASLHSAREREGAWQSCITDLQRVGSLDRHVTSSASCAATFIQCQLLINKVSGILSQDILLSSGGSSQQQLAPLLADIRELLLLGYRLECCFTGLTSDLFIRSRMVRLLASALSLQLAAHLNMDTEQSELFQAKKTCFQERMKSIKGYCEKECVPIPPLLEPLLSHDIVLQTTEQLNQALVLLTQAQFCTDLPLPSLQSVCQTRAELLSPRPSEESTSFVSSLALSVSVLATISNLLDKQHLAVQVTFPDGKRLVFPVKPAHIRESTPNEMILDTSIVLSHGIWTEPSYIELCLVLRYQPDTDESTCLRFPGGVTPALSRRPVTSHYNDSLDNNSSLVISECVRVSIHPVEKSSASFGAFSDPVNRL